MQTKDVKKPICLRSELTNDLKIKTELDKKLKQDTCLRERINRQHKHVGTKSEPLQCKVSYNLKGIKRSENNFINTLEIWETEGGRQLVGRKDEHKTGETEKEREADTSVASFSHTQKSRCWLDTN